VSTVVRNLPVGYAREVYCSMRVRGQSVAVALAKAAEVDACTDDFLCARCRVPAAIADAHVVRDTAGEALGVICSVCRLKWLGLT
jgi:hypothetical protein